ncbi:unnamed protein product [Adineta steineri]|uniref:6-bladed beta-propeller n=1 Tax=Adineta steineri TaxID=433720 RepID=A0A813TSG6_9BILA|nr:unnamed protein product [Adineta steineri]CAF3721044.1 unnamed protein product [Adineta steineri]
MSNNNYPKWNLNFSIVAGGNGYGNDLDQVSLPLGFYIDDDNQTIYITNYNSDRVVGWKFGEKSGKIVAGGNGPGDGNKRVVQWSRQNQIDPQIIIPEIKCNGVTIDNNGDIYVSEGETHSVKQFKQGEAEGRIVAGGHGCGYEPKQLNDPTYIFVDKQYSIYVFDYKYGRVTKWMKNAKEGIVVAKERIPEHAHSWPHHPFGMAVDHFGSKEGYPVMDGGGFERPPNLFDAPAAISLDGEGNLYVADNQLDRIVKFDVDVD